MREKATKITSFVDKSAERQVIDIIDRVYYYYSFIIKIKKDKK